jgi:hypothetical protein
MTYMWMTVALVMFVTFIAWANRNARKEFGRSTHEHVEKALLNFTAAADGDYYDDWDLFLAWPIDDPYLESVRVRCLDIIGNKYENHTPEAVDQVAKLLEELRSHTEPAASVQ